MGRKHKKSAESKLIRLGVANFERRTSRVIQAREGLGGQKPVTLDGIGKVLGLTRERVRQIESRFWKKIKEFPNKYGKPFVDVLLCNFINESGDLLYELSSRRTQVKDFLFKCCGVPTVKVGDLGVFIAGVSSKQVTALLSMLTKKSDQETNVDKIATYLECKIGLVLTRRDIVYLAKNIANYRVERIGMSKRIKKTLQSIGKPAHYSKIATVHNTLFPKNQILDATVHNLLTNNTDGIVWIGVRGTYALKEWGYRRPSSTIFDAIAKIVKIRYRETGRPVPIIVIKAELGKLRKIVKDVSIAIATSMNPRIQAVGNNSFIPRKMSKQKSAQILEEKLDRGLEDFLQISRVANTDEKSE